MRISELGQGESMSSDSFKKCFTRCWVLEAARRSRYLMVRDTNEEEKIGGTSHVYFIHFYVICLNIPLRSSGLTGREVKILASPKEFNLQEVIYYLE